MTDKAFDDFAAAGTDDAANRRMLGLDRDHGRDERHRVRLGMVGGGQGAFIGAVHRIAARLDDDYDLVCGALSSDPDRAHASAAEIGLDPAAQLRLLRRDVRRGTQRAPTGWRRWRS